MESHTIPSSYVQFEAPMHIVGWECGEILISAWTS